MGISQDLRRPIVAGQRLVYALALGAAALAVLLTYLPPLLLRSILDSGLGGAPWRLPEPLNSLVLGLGPGVGGPIVAAIGAMVLASLGAAALNFGASFGTQRTAEVLAQRLRQALYQQIQLLSYEDLAQAPTGDWVQRSTSDIDTLRRLVALQFPELVNNILQASWALPILFWVHAPLALFAIPLLPLVLGVSFFFFTRVQRAFRQSDESEGRLSGILQETITGIRVVKAFSRKDFEMERFDRENQHYRDTTRHVVNLFALYWGSVNLLSMIQMGLVLVMGIAYVQAGSASIGTVVLFVSMTGMLVWPIRQLGRVLTDVGKAQVSWQRILEIFQRPIEDLGPEGPDTRTWQGQIEFRGVSVVRAGRTLLHELSFTIPAGKTVALLGPTGSGKTTLVLLLAGLLEYSGEIWLDGQELRTIRKRELRRQVGLVLQEPYLFAKTIGENIGLAHHDAQQTEVVEAAQRASLHEVVQGFQHGYDTLLGERGVTLSGGQRQRTAISQMLVRPRPVLVFDDSLSAVDNHTDAQIRRALQRRRGTVILISHRLSTLAQADWIFVLEKGRLVQQGDHATLVEQAGLYRRMAELQNSLRQEWDAVGGV